MIEQQNQDKSSRGAKWWGIRVGVAVVLGAGVFLSFNASRIKRLLAANSLFKEGKIDHNFTHMDELFHAQTMTPTAPKKLHTWVSEPSPLPTSFTFDGKSRDLQAFLKETSTTALLVVHDGKIVHENYPNPEKSGGQEARRISWSVAKSFLSAIFGLAVASGEIKSLEDPVSDYVPELKGSAYDGVPIRHVLNMSSGVFFDEDYLSFNSDINKMGRVLAIGGSMDEFAAGLSKTERASGEVRDYVSIDTHVIGMVLRRATGKSVLEYLNENLWSKMGVKESIYYVTDEQGVAFVLGGLNMRTRDYARFGQLFLQDGQWLGQQVLPREWVRASTANSAPASLTDDQGYGYQWWLPEQADEEFFAIGIYGQYIYVNRKLNVVIAKNSAHREFRDDGKEGFIIKNTTIEAFRAMAHHYAKP